MNKVEVNPTDVLPGTLIYVVQKGLQYMEVEAAIQEVLTRLCADVEDRVTFTDYLLSFFFYSNLYLCVVAYTLGRFGVGSN